MSTTRWKRRIALAVVTLTVVGILVHAMGGDSAVLMWRAQAALQQRRWSDADLWLSRHEMLAGPTAENAFARARLHRKLGQLGQMAESLSQAQAMGLPLESLRREHWMAMAQAGRLNELERHLSQLFVVGKDLPELCEAFVAGCLLTYRLDDALPVLDAWQRDFPADPQPLLLRGRIAEFRTKPQEAERDYREALRCDPQFSAAAFGLARLLAARDPDAAIEYFHLCAKHHVDPQPALVSVSRLLRQQGKPDEAAEVMEQAMRSPADRLDLAYRLLGEPGESAHSQAPAEFGHVQLALEDYSDARKWYETALAANPNDWRVRYSLSVALRQLGRIDEAAEQSRRFTETQAALAECDRAFDVLRSDPQNVEARFQIGRTLLEYVSKQQGRLWLRTVLAYDPDHEEARQLLADHAADSADGVAEDDAHDDVGALTGAEAATTSPPHGLRQ